MIILLIMFVEMIKNKKKQIERVEVSSLKIHYSRMRKSSITQS